MKTAEELEKLKRDWLKDPCWDIEDTEGFEGHYDELKAFSNQQNEIWAAKRARRMERKAAELEKKAETLGCPGNVALAAYIEQLEQRLTALEELNNI